MTYLLILLTCLQISSQVTMNSKGIFVFGSKIFDEVTKRDAISTLPLELSWKIFSYLDDTSLQVACHLNKTWSRIISANNNLRSRLNKFELELKLGSKSLARFHRRNVKRLRRERIKNYLTRGEQTDHSMKKEIFKSKRQGGDITIYTKRFKLF